MTKLRDFSSLGPGNSLKRAALELSCRRQGADVASMLSRVPDAKPATIITTFGQCVLGGLMERRGVPHHRVYFATEAGRQLLRAKPMRMKQPAVMQPKASRNNYAQRKREHLAVRAVVPDSVKVTVCPPAPEFDPRFSIDPATFAGGEFVAEWRRLRG